MVSAVRSQKELCLPHKFFVHSPKYFSMKRESHLALVGLPTDLIVDPSTHPQLAAAQCHHASSKNSNKQCWEGQVAFPYSTCEDA